MDSRTGIKPLQHNPRADVREGWAPRGTISPCPSPCSSKFIQEMETVARERFGEALDRLTSETRVAIEEDVSDPIRWSARPNSQVQGWPGCAGSSTRDGAPKE